MKDRCLTLSRVLRDRASRDGYAPPSVVPSLRVQGRWLERAGFRAGARVQVEVQPGRLVVTPYAEDD